MHGDFDHCINVILVWMLINYFLQRKPKISS
jgi:hypothetical protein